MALALVWIFNLVETLDLLNAFYWGISLNVGPHMGSAWYVPTFVVTRSLRDPLYDLHHAHRAPALRRRPMPKMLDLIQMGMRGEIPPPPIATLIGFTLASIEPGRAVIEFEATERHANPMGTLHGGVLCDVADAAMGLAYAAKLDEGETFTTLELKINFVRPFWTGKLVAEGRVKGGGRTVGLVECHVRDARERLVAHATSTCMTLRDERAAGR